MKTIKKERRDLCHAVLLANELSFSDLFHLGNVQNENGCAADLDFFGNAHVAHTHAEGSGGSGDLLPGGAVLLQNVDNLLGTFVVGTDQEGGVTDHQETTGGSQSGDPEAGIGQSGGGPCAVIIVTDAPRMKRIFENLFSNILKYADKSAPVSILCRVSECKLLLTITNKVNENATNVESNRIGLKTCQKLARSIGIGFESERQGEYFAVKMSLDATKED